MKKVMLAVFLLLLLGPGTPSQAQNNPEVKNPKSKKTQTGKKMNNKNSQEKLDLETFYKTAQKTEYASGGVSYHFYEEYPDSRTVEILDYPGGGFQKKEANVPKPFHKTLSDYYPDGSLKQKGVLFAEHTPLGVWIHYDEKGNRTEVNHDDVPARKVSSQDLLDLMQKEGIINLSAPPEVIKRDAKWFNAVYDKTGNTWYFRYQSSSYMITEYVIDAKDGKILSKKQFQGGIM